NEALERREEAVQPALEPRDRATRVRGDPRRGALEDVQPLDLRLDRGHVLDRRRARADRGDALAGEVVVVVPARRVEGGPLEGAARVGVVVPRAADVVAALEHHEVVPPLLLQPDRHAEAREPAPDYRDVHFDHRLTSGYGDVGYIPVGYGSVTWIA